MHKIIPLLTTTVNTCWDRLPKTLATVKKLKVGSYVYKGLKFRLERKRGENLIYLLNDTDYPTAGLICKHTLELPALKPDSIELMPLVCQLYLDLSQGITSNIKKETNNE